MKQLHVIFRGRVQGVGFRFTAERMARQFAVTGFVRNLEQGSVELTAEGEDKVLQEFLQSLRDSRLSYYIEDLELSWHEPQGKWKGFSIIA